MAVVAGASRRSFRPRDQRCLSGWPTMTGMVRQVFSRGSAWEDRHVCRKRSALGDILKAAPEAYGLDSGVWTSPMIGRAVEAESASCSIWARGGSCWPQLASRFNIRDVAWLAADATRPARWRRTTSPPLKKIPNRRAGLLLTEEASFQQDSRSTRPVADRLRPEVAGTGQ